MCSYSMIADHYRDILPQRYPGIAPAVYGPNPSAITREEFDALKRDIEDMKTLLLKAKDYDARTGQPDCEKEEKVELLRKIAKLVGVDLGEALSG